MTAALPPPLGARALLGTYDGTWVGRLLGEVTGRSPAVPWLSGSELMAMEALWPEAGAGNRLLQRTGWL